MPISSFEDAAPDAPRLTAYLADYIRLLDAADAGTDWRETVTMIFGLDPFAEPERANRVYQSYLARARWMTEIGYSWLLDPCVRQGRGFDLSLSTFSTFLNGLPIRPCPALPNIHASRVSRQQRQHNGENQQDLDVWPVSMTARSTEPCRTERRRSAFGMLSTQPAPILRLSTHTARFRRGKATHQPSMFVFCGPANSILKRRRYPYGPLR